MWNVCENDDYDDNHDDDDADDGQQTSFDQRGSLEPSAWWAKKTQYVQDGISGIWKYTFVYIKLRPQTNWSGSHKGESVKVYCFCNFKFPTCMHVKNTIKTPLEFHVSLYTSKKGIYVRTYQL